MVRERTEDYLGAIYRLRDSATSPVPISRLGEYFGFSVVSIHEMIQKLEKEGWVIYQPYRGVILTEPGETIALALLRRHRLWERFLTDYLDIPWDKAHEAAEELEHSASELVTDQLSHFMGDPCYCPHGGPIPPLRQEPTGYRLIELRPQTQGEIIRISPELPEVLRTFQAIGVQLHTPFVVLEKTEAGVKIGIAEQEVYLSSTLAQTVWVDVKD